MEEWPAVVWYGISATDSVLLAMRIPLIPTGTDLAAFMVVVCFSDGLNVYATVAMLGLLSRAGSVTLPGSLHGIENWYVIGLCCALFLVELVGDKIPIFDLVWNAAQTFVRIPIAALLAYAASSGLPPYEQMLATLDKAGVFGRVLEGIPCEVASTLTSEVCAPTLELVRAQTVMGKC